jgi:N-acetyl sugar amidotransferase
VSSPATPDAGDGAVPGGYRICPVCIMDTSYREIAFDASGRCNFCLGYQAADQARPSPEKAARILAESLQEIRRRGASRDYDCVLGLSGGVDSSFLACQLKEWGLRPLAVQFDNGWNTELATHNIRTVCKSLDIDLFTYVVDWNEFRDLQRAFLLAGVANVEAPSDHGIFACIYRTAREKGIPYVVSGVNHVTEYARPLDEKANAMLSTGHRYDDLVQLNAIHRRFGHVPLKTFPRMGLMRRLWLERTGRIRRFDPLNYMPYNKKEALDRLVRELGWRPYEGKHHESVITRFHQCYILPVKFGIDKRRMHLSNLIWCGQLSRDEALAEIARPPCSPDTLRNDKTFVCKKLGFTEPEFDRIMGEPPRWYSEYPYSRWLLKCLRGAKAVRRALSGR